MEVRAGCFHTVFHVFLVVCFFSHFHARGQQGFSQQGFGSFNLSTIPQNMDNLLKRSSGLYCVNRALEGGGLSFFSKQFRFGSVVVSREVMQDEQIFFMQPSHVGKLDGALSSDTALLLTIQKSIGEYEVCYRSFAHLRVLRDRGRINSQSADRIVNWLSVDAMGLKESYTRYRLDKYGCRNVPVIGNFGPIRLLSLLHPDDVVTIQKIEFHYDAIWLGFNDDITSICWEDSPALNGTHKQVSVQSIIVDPSTSVKNGYLARTVSFSWPGGKDVSGACVDIPFDATFDAVPITFATLNLQSIDKGDAYNSWVDSSGFDGFRVCMAHSFWGTGSRAAGTATYINYLAVQSVLPVNQTLFFEGSGVLRIRGLAFSSIPVNPDRSIEFTNLLSNYLGEVAGIPASKFSYLDVVDRFDEETIYFFMKNVTDLVSAQRNLRSRFGSSFQETRVSRNVSSAEYKFVSRYHGRPVLGTMITQSTSCSFAPVTFSACSTVKCGIPGTQRFTVTGDNSLGDSSCKWITYDQRCNLSPCTNRSATYGLRVDLDKNLVGISGGGGPNVGLLVGVIIGGLIVVVVGVLGALYFRSRKSIHIHSNKKQQIQAVVLGNKALLSSG